MKPRLIEHRSRRERAPALGRGVHDPDRGVGSETFFTKFHTQARAFDAAKGTVRGDLRMFVEPNGAGLQARSH